MGLAELRKALEKAVAALDPDVLDGTAAARAVQEFARIENLGAAGKALCARRVADSGAWRTHGDQSPADWLARTTQSSIGQADRLLEAAERLKELPATAKAFRAGRLSETAVGEIAATVALNPLSEKRILACAEGDSLSGLRERCRAKRASAQDELDRHRRIHRSRSLRTWVDTEGAGCAFARGPADALAKLRAVMQPFESAVFEQARHDGRREPQEAYAFDAFMAMVEAKGGSGGPKAKVTALIDHAALVRGRAEPNETCEIAGVGRVAVATVTSMMGDAFLAAVVTDGVDVYNVAHLGRQPTAYQRTAIEARDRHCVVPGCHVRTGVEIDHVDGWAATRRTKLTGLALLCQFHHHQKTYEGYRLDGEPGRWRWIPPPQAHAPPDAEHDEREPDLDTAIVRLEQALREPSP